MSSDDDSYTSPAGTLEVSSTHVPTEDLDPTGVYSNIDTESDSVPDNKSGYKTNPNLSDTILEASETEKSGDTPDSNSPYRSTTELIESSDSDVCCGCCAEINSRYLNCRKSFAEFSNRQWRMLAMLCLGTLTSSLSVCLFPPFYPKLAESKGESATMYGMVIGTNCLTAFIVTPIIGKNMEKIGVNFAFVTGMFSSGVCCCLSGFLEYFTPGYKFVIVSILIRLLHATANAHVITSSIAFISSEFPHSVAFLFSLTRATMNLAQMVGPALGGALHDVGGFKMPFFVLGSIHVFFSLVCAFVLPQFRGRPRNTQTKLEKRSIWSIVKVPGIWVCFLTFFFSTMSNGFLSITLEPRVLREFNMSPFYVGLLFGLKDGANCLASPFWGWMCDRTSKIKLMIIIGSLMAAMSFILIGPFPGLPLHHTIALVIISLILNGFGIGGQQVSGVISAMKDAVHAGFPDEADTHSFIAGLWSSLSGAGRFISRAGSGILVDTIGFRPTSAIVTSLHLCILITTIIYMCLSDDGKREPESPGKRRKSYQINVETNSPSEPTGSKTASVAIPIMREDLEDSFMIGSTTSVPGKL